MKRSYRGTVLIIILILLLTALIVLLSTGDYEFKKTYRPPTALSETIPRFRLIDLDKIPIKTDRNKNGNNDSKDIVIGAKKQLEIESKNIFIEGSEEPNYYKDGDPPENWALCTDIIARSFKEAGYDLRVIINEDIKENFDEYPLRKLWGQTGTDIDIDYRRIQNMEVFFKRNAKSLTKIFDSSDQVNLDSWIPGDVVFFDMDKNGFSDNAGIISDDTNRNGSPKVIYNYVEPGYTIQDNILSSETITGHYRYP